MVGLGIVRDVLYVFGSPVSRFAFALVEAILLVGNHTISEYLRTDRSDLRSSRPHRRGRHHPARIRIQHGRSLVAARTVPSLHTRPGGRGRKDWPGEPC